MTNQVINISVWVATGIAVGIGVGIGNAIGVWLIKKFGRKTNG